MRITAQVFLGYALLLGLGAVWRLLPLETAMPNVVALCAVYLGLTARPVVIGSMALYIAPPTLGAVILGYLGDLMTGTPKGLLALTAGVVCVVGHLIHSALIVRGRLLTFVFAAVTGLAAGLILLVIRAMTGLIAGGVGSELWMLFTTTLVTGLAGPVVFAVCRHVDARFARTHRERDATLGGISP